MTNDDFYNTMRKFMNRKPFFPFLVELIDGRRIIIAQPHVAFNPEAAGFIDLS